MRRLLRLWPFVWRTTYDLEHRIAQNAIAEAGRNLKIAWQAERARQSAENYAASLKRKLDERDL